MNRFKEIAGNLWTRYRGLPIWAQVVIGIVAVSTIVGPFLGDTDKASDGDAREITNTTEPPATEDTTTTTESAPPPSEGELSGFAECTDPPSDGIGGDLLSARLAVDGPVLTIGYETAAPLTGPSFSYYINIFSANYQIGLRSIDGEIVRFVADFGEGQEDLTSAYTLDGTVATLAVPLSSLPNLEQPFDYTAVITVDGQDADECAGTFGER